MKAGNWLKIKPVQVVGIHPRLVMSSSSSPILLFSVNKTCRRLQLLLVDCDLETGEFMDLCRGGS